MKKEGALGAATLLAIAAVVGVSLHSGPKPEANGSGDQTSAIRQSKPSKSKRKTHPVGSACSNLQDQLEDFLDIAEADFDRVIRVNLKGMFLIGQVAAKQMVAQAKAGKPPGVIVNMSSINARVAIPNQVPYCVSKGGVDQLTKVMALSLAPYRIRVNAIGPGSIMTDILKAVATDKEAKRRLLSRTPLGRIGEPDEIAAIAVFLASDDASYVTGQTIYADGGRLGLNYTVPVADAALD